MLTLDWLWYCLFNTLSRLAQTLKSLDGIIKCCCQVRSIEKLLNQLLYKVVLTFYSFEFLRVNTFK